MSMLILHYVSRFSEFVFGSFCWLHFVLVAIYVYACEDYSTQSLILIDLPFDEYVTGYYRNYGIYFRRNRTTGFVSKYFFNLSVMINDKSFSLIYELVFILLKLILLQLCFAKISLNIVFFCYY